MGFKNFLNDSLLSGLENDRAEWAWNLALKYPESWVIIRPSDPAAVSVSPGPGEGSSVRSRLGSAIMEGEKEVRIPQDTVFAYSGEISPELALECLEYNPALVIIKTLDPKPTGDQINESWGKIALAEI